MARSELRANLKFRKLVRALRIPPPYAVGLLETMWQVSYQSGNDELGTPDDVELAAEWPGRKGSFFEAVRTAGFLEQRGSIWCVHDLSDHAPEYVKKKLKRRQYERSLKIKDLHKETADIGRQMADNVGSTQYTQYTQPNTPNPTQAPGGACGTASAKLVRQSGRSQKNVEVAPEGFVNFWNEWPDHFRKKGRTKCLKLWIARNLEPMSQTIVASVRRWKKCFQWTKEGGRFLPGPHPWLMDEAWEAPVAEGVGDEDVSGVTREEFLSALPPEEESDG